jgi:hypothetical protein
VDWWKVTQRIQEGILALGERSVTWVATSGLRITLIFLLAGVAARLLKAFSHHLRRLFAGDGGGHRA